MSAKKTSVNHKCPCCRANLTFNPKEQNWICEYCDSKFELDDLKKNEEKFEKKEVSEEIQGVEGNFDVYRCPDCGAEIITDANTVATFCIYCKNTSIIKERLVGKFELKRMIPFQTTRDDAVKAFVKLKKGHPLMPKEFNDQKNIMDIRGIYIPFWLFSSSVNGHLVSDCKRVRTGRRGDYEYITTETFEVVRDGVANFSYVPNDGSKKFDDNIMNSIEPYDYSKLVDFSPSYLAGFYAEKYDLDSDEAKNNVCDRIKSSMEFMLNNTVRGYSSSVVKEMDVRYDDLVVEYVFLPVWFLNIKYKDKMHTFAMNGETGRLVGDIPVDRKKVWFFFLIFFVISFMVCVVIFYLFIRSNV